MENKKVGSAEKGSRYCLQEYIEKDNKKFSEIIVSSSFSLMSFLDKDLKIAWKSPIKDNNFYEYRDDFLEVLNNKNIAEAAVKELRKFWPKNGPQWDGIAVAEGKENKKGFLLIEAKAHTDETKSDMRAVSDKSIEIINKAFNEVQSYMGVKQQSWTNEYYQLANRIAYLYFLNVKLNIPSWLVLINFTDDASYKPTTVSKWLSHYNMLAEKIGINHNCKLLDKIITVFISANDII